MVIFDTKNKTKNTLGTLYLSFSDLFYLADRIRLENLLKLLPVDFANKFMKEFVEMSAEDYLSHDFFLIEKIPISEKQVELLRIIKKEIDEENLFTREQLTTMPEYEVCRSIDETQRDLSKMNIRKLSRLRSFILAYQILEDKKKAYRILDKWDAENLYDVYEYKTVLDSLKEVGVTSKIYESDYFKLKIKK